GRGWRGGSSAERTCTKRSSVMRVLPTPRCPTAGSGIASRFRRSVGVADRGLADVQPGRAFELALGQLRRQLRIHPALARLAEIAGAHGDLQSPLGVSLFAGLLDEQRADGALAVRSGARRAIAR